VRGTARTAGYRRLQRDPMQPTLPYMPPTKSDSEHTHKTQYKEDRERTASAAAVTTT
jgi:hypothetical protein